MPQAARMTDTTDHGGTITQGSSKVLIKGLPAARLGDSFCCPMVSGHTPHVGGSIVTGSGQVLIEGRPAARVGDVGACNGPPCVIVQGADSVLIGG